MKTKTNQTFGRSVLALSGFALMTLATMADPIEAVKGRYDDNDWFNKAESWEDNELPDPTKDYIISGNYKSQKADGSYVDYVFRFAKNNQVFNGRSIQFGDPAVYNSRYINMCMSEGVVTFNNEGLMLGAGTLCSWWADGTAAAQRVHSINGKIEVVAPASAPYTMGSAGKKYFTFNFTGAFSGASDRGLKLSADGVSFIWNFANAAGYCGDLTFVGQQTATATARMNQVALRTLTFADGATFELTSASEANTVGTFAASSANKVVFEQFPGTALTITNSLTGGIEIDLLPSASIPGLSNEAWTNDYPILTLAADVSFDSADVVINDRLGAAVSEGLERSIRTKVNADGSTTYYYRLCQPYPMFFAASSHGTDPSQSAFWQPVDGRTFVSPLSEDASAFAYCDTTKGRTSFNVATYSCAQLLLLKGSFGTLHTNPTFLNDGLVLGDGAQLYNWNAKNHYTLSGKVTVLGKLTVGNDSKETSSIRFSEGTLHGDENAVITHTTAVSVQNVGFVVQSAENYRGSFLFNGFDVTEGCGVYFSLGSTGTSSVKSVRLGRYYTLNAVTAADLTTVRTLEFGDSNKLVPMGDGTTLSCLTAAESLSISGGRLTVDASTMTYPRPEEGRSGKFAVLKWPKDAGYTINNFQIYDTQQRGLRRNEHRWGVWEEGDMACLGVIWHRAGLILMCK